MRIFKVHLTDQNGHWHAQGLKKFGIGSESALNWRNMERISSISYQMNFGNECHLKFRLPMSLSFFFSLGHREEGTTRLHAMSFLLMLKVQWTMNSTQSSPMVVPGHAAIVFSPWEMEEMPCEKPWCRWHKYNSRVPADKPVQMQMFWESYLSTA